MPLVSEQTWTTDVDGRTDEEVVSPPKHPLGWGRLFVVDQETVGVPPDTQIIEVTKEYIIDPTTMAQIRSDYGFN